MYSYQVKPAFNKIILKWLFIQFTCIHWSFVLGLLQGFLRTILFCDLHFCFECLSNAMILLAVYSEKVYSLGLFQGFWSSLLSPPFVFPVIVPDAISIFNTTTTSTVVSTHLDPKITMSEPIYSKILMSVSQILCALCTQNINLYACWRFVMQSKVFAYIVPVWLSVSQSEYSGFTNQTMKTNIEVRVVLLTNRKWVHCLCTSMYYYSQHVHETKYHTTKFKNIFDKKK